MDSFRNQIKDLLPERQVELLLRRLERSENARLAAEQVLESRARELDRINKQVLEREEALRERLEFGNRQLLAAQRTARIATIYRERRGRFLVSPEFGEILGLAPGREVTAQAIAAAVHLLDRKRVNRQEFEFYTSLEPNEDHTYEHRIIRENDRQVRWLRWKLRRETSPNGSFVSVFGTVQDITEQRRIERQAKALRLLAERRVNALSQLTEELHQSNLEAEEANRSKSQFLAMMSHDIRTPMNGVLGMLDTIARGELSPEQRRQLELARRSGQQLNLLLNDIIEIVRTESGNIDLQPEQLRLSRTLQGIVEFWRAANTNPMVDLTCDLDDDLPQKIMVDPTRFRQLVDNFISNALKYTPKGSVIIRAHSTRESLRIEVEDTGPGIEEGQMENLFSEFSRLKTIAMGSVDSAGLGLAICRRLVEAMDGSIGVDSEPGKGSTFWFELPLVTVVEFGRQRRKKVEPLPDAGAKLSAHILVAEDIETNREVLAAMLELAGCTYTMVPNGEQAVEAVLNGNFDIVLMDVNMPVMDGIAATRKIRGLSGAKSRIPIAGVTAHAMQQQRDELLTAGMDAVVSKPVDFAGLTACISDLVQEGDKVQSDQGADLLDEGVSRLLFDALPADRRDKIIDLSLKDISQLAGEILAAMRDGDSEKAGRAAHSLKGVSGNVGAVRLASMLEDPSKLDPDVLAAVAADTVSDIRRRFGPKETDNSIQ